MLSSASSVIIFSATMDLLFFSMACSTRSAAADDGASEAARAYLVHGAIRAGGYLLGEFEQLDRIIGGEEVVVGDDRSRLRHSPPRPRCSNCARGLGGRTDTVRFGLLPGFFRCVNSNELPADVKRVTARRICQIGTKLSITHFTRRDSLLGEGTRHHTHTHTRAKLRAAHNTRKALSAGTGADRRRGGRRGSGR